MKFNIHSIELQSFSFARVMETYCPEMPLDDFTLYVVAGDDTRMRRQIAQAASDADTDGPAMHYSFAIRELPAGNATVNDFFGAYIEEGMNLIMPVETKDRDSKVLLMGSLDEPEYLREAFDSMAADAQKIADECSFAAFTDLINIDPEAAKSIWIGLVDSSARAKRDEVFRTKYAGTPSHYSFLGNQYASAYKKVMVNYQQRNINIQKFPETILSFNNKEESSNKNSRSKDFVDFCNSLSPSEKHELILELARTVGDSSVLRRIIDKVTRKDAKAGMKIKMVSRTNDLFISNNRQGDYQLHLVKTDQNGKETRKLIDIESGALVIYIMNLVYIIEHGAMDKPLNISSDANLAAFKRIFSNVYPLGYRTANGKYEDYSTYDNKELRPKINPWIYSIVNCINTNCMAMGEEPAPYRPSANTVMKIPSDDILIPEYIYKGIEIS